MPATELVLVGALVVLVSAAVPFAVTTALRHNDPANRLWCGGLIAALGAGLAPLLDDSPLGVVDLDTAGAACAVVTFGFLWSGLRWFRGAAPLPAAPLLLALTVVLAHLLLDAVDSPVQPSGYLGAAVFAVLAIVELHRGPMHRNVNASILQVVLGAFALAASVNVVAARTYDGGAEVSAGLLVVAVVITVQMLVSIRAERDGAWWSEDHGSGRVFGVHSREQFLEAAADRLRRLDLRGGHAGLLLAEISDLVGLNDAFGRRGGDIALATLADSLRRHVPAWSVLGYLGAGRFAVLAPAESHERTIEIAAAVERALYARTAEPGEAQDLPVPVLFGVADTFTCPADVEELLDAAASSRRS